MDKQVTLTLKCLWHDSEVHNELTNDKRILTCAETTLLSGSPNNSVICVSMDDRGGVLDLVCWLWIAATARAGEDIIGSFTVSISLSAIFTNTSNFKVSEITSKARIVIGRRLTHKLCNISSLMLRGWGWYWKVFSDRTLCPSELFIYTLCTVGRFSNR